MEENQSFFLLRGNKQDIEGENDDKKLDEKDYSELQNEFYSINNQNEIEQLNNDTNKIIQYFYLRELLIEDYINQKYKNNDNKRLACLKEANDLFMSQFGENKSTRSIAKSINQLISGINKSYFDNKNNKNLSEKNYMNEIDKVFGTKEFPKFLLQEGFRRIKEINNNNKIIIQKENDNNNNINNNINIKDLIKNIENNENFHLEKRLNEMYLILLILSFQVLKNININNIIEKNLNIFFTYFEIIRINNFREFKRKYMDIDIKDLQLEIYSMEFSQVNDSEYSIKYILAICYVVISQLFKDANNVYRNFLSFLQNFMNFIQIENNNFIIIIENELIRCLFNNNDNNNNNNDNINKNLYKQNKNDENNHPNINIINEHNNYHEDNYHETKSLDFNSIIEIFNNINNPELRNRFFQIVQEEEYFEGQIRNSSITFKLPLDLSFEINTKKSEQRINNHLQLDPYKEGIFHQGPILILISGYSSSKNTFNKDWIKFIDVYKEKFNNPIIYHYLWPASNLSFEKVMILGNDYMTTRKKAKFCGILLALMILSNEIFSGFKINLAGFDLGCHIIKHCIKELESYKRLNIINNIIFLGGATDFKNIFRWEQRLNSFKGVIINCYSKNDIFLLKINEKLNIGTRNLEIKGVNIKNYSVKTFHCLYSISLDIIGKYFKEDLIE